MNRHRLAALRLAALARADREWLLGRLPLVDRLAITREMPAAMRLHALDPEQCSRWLRQLLQSSGADASAVAEEDLDAIDCAAPESVVKLLKGLPPVLQAEILVQRPWRWKLAWLEQLSETERQRVMACLQPPGALRIEARKALLRMCAQAISSPSGQPGAFDNWMRPARPVVSAA